MWSISNDRERLATTSRAVGNFATILGFFLLPIYLVGFGLLLPYARGEAVLVGGPTGLPAAPPLIGLSLAVVGLVLALGQDRGARSINLTALALNGASLALAMWLASGLA